MQDLCGLQGIFDLFNCKTPVLLKKTTAGRRKKQGIAD